MFFIWGNSSCQHWSLVVDSAVEEREGHVTVVLEDIHKPLLEAAAVLDKVGDVAAREGVVEHLQEDLVKEGEEVALDKVPDHGAQQVEDVVDCLSKVSSTNKVVQVNCDVSEVCSDVHFRDLGEEKKLFQKVREHKITWGDDNIFWKVDLGEVKIWGEII